MQGGSPHREQVQVVNDGQCQIPDWNAHEGEFFPFIRDLFFIYHSL